MTRAVIAFIGDSRAAGLVAEQASRHSLRPLHSDGGLYIFAGSSLPVRSLTDGTIVVGDLFSRSGATSDRPRDGWGSYLAFKCQGSHVRVSRAPMTGMPLYRVQLPGGLLCASEFQTIAPLVERPAFDWEWIAHALAYPNLRTERTGLAGVLELLPGAVLEVREGQTHTDMIWSPWDHANVPAKTDMASLSLALERRLLACVSARSAGREIILELSGGLDSSIVAAALAAASADFRAVTFVTSGADGDERIFARAVAAQCGFDLIELPHDQGGIDLVGASRSLLPRPGAYAVLGGIDRAFEAEGFGPDVSVFGGIGGDNVFAFDTTVAPILDAASAFGPGRRALATARDVARAANTTLWHALLLANRARRAGARGWRRETSFCDPAGLPERPFVHPWDARAGEFPRGKRNHVAALRRILDFLDRPGRWQGRDVVAPLLSQPLVELCLSIPSWVWLSGGRDRAVARAAFARRLPPDVVWRRGKGQLETLCAAAYAQQKPKLREILLGGRLADRGLLDLPAVEAYLAKELREGDFDYLRLLEIVDIERWIQGVDAAPFAPRRFLQR